MSTTADEEARLSSLEDEVISGDGYVFGQPDDKGISVGLRVDNPTLKTGEQLRYRVALRNQGQKAFSRVLWHNFDVGYPDHRTRLSIQDAAGSLKTIGTAVGRTKLEGESLDLYVTMELEPGQIRAREGNPQAMSEPGVFDVLIVWGGNKVPSELRSGTVRVQVTP